MQFGSFFMIFHFAFFYLVVRIQISDTIAEKFMKLLKIRFILVFTLAYCFLSCKSDGSMPKIFGSIPISNSVNVPARFVVSPTSSLNTSESGTSVQISISLNKAPAADVSINTITFSDPLEGTLNKNSLIFTTSNWNTAQVLTITGVDDLFVDGDKNSTLTFSTSTSTDTEFNGLTINSLTITNQDNDVLGVATIGSTGLITSETGTNANFTVVLTSQPTANVTIPTITSSNTSEGTVSPATLTFTTSNWNIPQTVTVTGVDDVLSDGNQTYLVQFSAATSSDSNYNGVVASSVSVTNTDNETFGVTVSAISGATTEAGGTATFNVVLTSASTSSVTIPIASGNTAEGTVSSSSLTFTPGNWNVPQVVTVTGVDDFVQDGNIVYTINLGPCSSSNSNYQGLVPASVSVTNNDNDTAGYTITPSAGTMMVSDGGQLSSSFTIVLTSQPTASVTIPVSSTLPGEVTLSSSNIIFTTSNWNIAQTVTLSGVLDGITDGNQSFTITLSLPTTSDAVYAALDPADQNGGSCDNDAGGAKIVACRAVNNPSTTEGGGTADYYIILSQAPTANVTIPVSSSNTGEGTVSTASVVMTTANWNQFLPSNLITVTGVNDALYDGDITYTIQLGAATSADPFFNGVDPADFTIVNTDNEVYFTISAISGNTSEIGTPRTFTIVLPSLPTGNVTFTLSSSNTGEGTVSPTNITFTTGNWNIAQTITVTGVDDNVADGNQTFSIDSTVATSVDLRYNGKTPASVSVTNLDAGEKRTFITTTPTNGILGGVAGADAICNADPAKPAITPNSYKAMIAVNATRTGLPLTGWVLAANTKYFLADGTTQIFTTNGTSVFTFGSLLTGFSGTSYWTGLTTTWGPNGSHCTNWTSMAGSGMTGDGSVTSSSSITNSTQLCNTTRNLVCVQQ
jgi:hypothetical protein